MRFVSKYGRLVVQIRPEIVEPFATGQVRVIQRGILAQFAPYGLTAEERDFALGRFNFQGWYQEQDEASMVPLDYRIGLFDSDAAARELGWEDETKRFVDEQLTALEYYGDVAPCPVIVLTPPWPKYDSYRGSPAQLIRKLIDEGHDLNYVLAYEHSDGPRRPAVIDALVDALSNESMDREEEVTA